MTTATVIPEGMSIPVEQAGLTRLGSLDVLDDGYFEQAVEYFKTQESQDTAPVELSFDERLEQEVQTFIAGVEDYAAAVAHESAPQETIEDQSPERWQRLRKSVGRVTLVGGLALGAGVSSFGAAVAIPAMIERTPVVSTVKAPVDTLAPAATLPTASPAMPAPVPEAPAKPFEAPVNSVIGTITIPKICEDIQMWEYDQSETPLVGTTQDSGLANGEVKLDTLEPDTERADVCKGIDDYAAAHPGYISRADWKAVTAINSENPSGNVNYYRPIVGHESAEGKPTTVYPGQVGVSVFYGHRSTYSASTKDIEVLEPNDVASVKRADGKAFAYRFTERLSIHPDNAYNELLAYYDIKVAQAKAAGQSPDIRMMVIGGCGDENGQPGGDATRVFAVFVM